MNDTILTATRARMQSEILGLRLVEALETASLADQQEARDALRYAQRLRFAMRRVDELRASAQQEATLFEAARLDVALTILEGHVFRAADFVDGIARRQRSELGHVNRRITGEAAGFITPVVAPADGQRAGSKAA
jgi:hypothetical protein